jgi:hypothetical protein
LYKDCLVGDVNLLIDGLEPKSRKEYLLNKVTTLRLYHPFDRSPDEPSYPDLFSKGKWAQTGKKETIQGHDGQIRRCYKDQGYADRYWGRTAGHKLRRTITDRGLGFERDHRELFPEDFIGKTPLGDEAFAKLERIIMMGTGDKSWGELNRLHDHALPFDAYPPMTVQHKLYGIPRKLDPRPIPHFLLGLGSVKHYCQTSLAGPLAIANEILQPVNSPKVVTFHISTRAMDEGIMPPIVIGAVNRYMCVATTIFCDFTDGNVLADHVVEDILKPLRNMLNRRKYGLYLYPDNIEYPLIDYSTEFENTSIEVYNYVRHVWVDNIDPITRKGSSNLRGFQDQLDRTAGMWRGKVILKNSEDAEPCSACGVECDKSQVPGHGRKSVAK